MSLLYITIFQLSKYKVYIGHSKLNSILLSSWLIFNFRGKNSILNLFNTIKMLKVSYHLIKNLVNLGFPVWFINFDLTKEYIIKQNANKSGEFFLTRRWIRGLISNYYMITKAYRKYLIKKEYINLKKVKDIYDQWLFTRFTWPRALFISDIKTTYIVSKEAVSARVATIALVDTNVKTFFYNIPIGSNDDSIESIGFMNNLMSQYIIQSKYKNVLVWFFFNRKISRYQGFFKWVQRFVLLKKKENKINIKKMIIPNYINYYGIINKGINFFFGRSYKYNLLKKKKYIYNNLYFDNFYNVNKNILYNKFKVFNYKKLTKKYKIRWKRSVFLKKIEGIASFKSFLNNFIKFTKSPKRFKWIQIKKRKKMERKKVSNVFKPFFYFFFYFYLNKFNILIDTYNSNLFKIHYLAQIKKTRKKEKEDYSIYIKNNNNKKIDNIKKEEEEKKKKKIKKYDIMYMFRYKSKCKFKWKHRRKFKFLKSSKELNFNNNENNMSFLFFFWKYFIIFLNSKIRLKSHNFKKIYSPVYM